MKQYDTVLFDLYGTLVDIHTDPKQNRVWTALAEFYDLHGAHYLPSELKRSYFRQIQLMEENLYDLYGSERTGYCPEIDIAEVFRALYRYRSTAELSDDLIAETALVLRNASRMHLRLYAGAEELLKALKDAGKTVILLSNAQRLFTVPELRMLGIYDLFDHIYISSDWQCRKPDPHFFEIPLKELNLNPKQCLMIGNDPFCDILGALHAGMDAYYIHDRLSPKKTIRRKELGIPPEYFQEGMNLRTVRQRLGV